MLVLPITYAALKSIATAKECMIHAHQVGNNYDLAINIDGITRTCTVLNGTADYTDFVNNLLASANVPQTPRDVIISDSTVTANKLAVDALGRVTVSISQLPPDEVTSTHITRYGTISSLSATDVLLNNATTVPSGYPPQNIEYTVPANKDFYLSGLSVAMDNPTAGRSIMVSMSLDGGTSKTVFFPINTDTNSFQEQKFGTAIYVPQNSIVRVYFRTSSPTAITAFIQFSGDEY